MSEIRDEIRLVLRRSARHYLGLKDGDYWDSSIADKQADALIAAGLIRTCSDPSQETQQRRNAT